MLLYAHSPRYYELLLKYNIEPSFIIPNGNKYIEYYKKLKFHLWIDTGMGRDGLIFQKKKCRFKRIYFFWNWHTSEWHSLR